MIHSMKISTLSAALALFGLSGCGSSGGESYFPLQVGAHWNYQLQTDMPDPPVDAHLEMSLDRQIGFAGIPTWIHRSESGVEYYLQTQPTGLLRVASRLDTEEQATLDAKPQMVLPTPLAVGANWDIPTVPFLMRRMAEFPRELKYRSHALMHYTVEALDDSVSVPAGKLEHCVRIRGSAMFRLFVDPVQGFADVPVTSAEWYCKGVGLARFDRVENLTSTFLTGGAISYVLTDYSL